jgi:hypothetical protein
MKNQALIILFAGILSILVAVAPLVERVGNEIQQQVADSRV